MPTCCFALLAALPALAQQLALPGAALAPATARSANASNLPTVSDDVKLPYLRQLARNQKLPFASLNPNPSDLKIQEAEDHFAAGRRASQSSDPAKARAEFDSAVALMLAASENPSDPALFEAEFEDMIDSIHREDLSGLGAAATAAPEQFDQSPLDDIIQMTFPVDPSIRNRVEDEIQNTASELPLIVNDTVLGYINYFSTGRGRYTMQNGLARAGKYKAMISRVLAEEGVPQELIHLAQAESGFQPRALSYKSAGGMWQFVKFRGNEYGLMQTPYSDDRLDPEKATRAAARHLHDLYNEFGDWYLAMAAYNCGPGTIEKAVEHTGYADFWKLRDLRVLPNETANYVPIIMAMVIVAKNPAGYGIDTSAAEEPVEYDTLSASDPVSLALLGDLTDRSIPELLAINPSLIKNTAPAGFELHVPKGMANDVAAALEMIPPDKRTAWRMHRVSPGENLAAISRRYNAPVSRIAQLNNIADGEALPGDRLVIPAAMVVAAPAKAASGRKASSAKAKVPAPKRPAAKAATIAQARTSSSALAR